MDNRDTRGFEPKHEVPRHHEPARGPEQRFPSSVRAGSPRSLQSAQYHAAQGAQGAAGQPVFRKPTPPKMRQQHPSRVNPHASQPTSRPQYRAVNAYQSRVAGQAQGSIAGRPQRHPMYPQGPDTARQQGSPMRPQAGASYPQVRPARPQNSSANRPQARPSRPQSQNALRAGRSYAHAGYSSNRAYSNRKSPRGYATPRSSRRSIFSGSSRYYSRKSGNGRLDLRLVFALEAILLVGFGAFSVYGAIQRNAAEVAAREEAAAQKEALKKQTVKPSKLGQTALPASTPKGEWKQGTLPHLYQTDPAWAEKPYAHDTVRISGCGPTSLTMVYVYLTGKTDYDPASMAAFADANNFAPTGATEWSFMSSGANMLGLYSQTLPVTRGEITRALNAGKPLIVSISPGDFTLVGHFMVLKSIDERGMVEVFDPNSPLRSSMRWPIMRMLPQINNVWAFSA